MTYHLGLDVGATNTRCIVVDDDVRPVERYVQTTPQNTTAEGFAESTGDAVITTLSACGLEPSDVDTFGIASFGPLDTEAGTITKAPNIDSDVTDVPLVETVTRPFPADVPTTLLNDAVAGVVAEHEHGNDEDGNVVYITLSSGIGAGVVVDGSVLRGRAGNAAEVGHFMLESDSTRQCGCGAYGHWEAFASGENIPEYAREIAEEEDLSTSLPLGEQAFAAESVFDQYGEDRLATEVIDRVGKWNTLGVVNVVHAFAPDRIAIGGPLARHNASLVVEPIIRSIETHLTVDAPTIHLTDLGEDVVIFGAIQYAMAQQD